MSCHCNWEIDGMTGAKKVFAIIGMVIMGIIAFAAFALVFGLVLRELWNWLMPEIFGLGTIDYWQAVGIFVLGKLLFGGCGHGGSKNRREKKIEARIEKKLEQKFCGRGDDYDSYWETEGRAAYERWKDGQRKED